MSKMVLEKEASEIENTAAVAAGPLRAGGHNYLSELNKECFMMLLIDDSIDKMSRRSRPTAPLQYTRLKETDS